MRCAPSAQFHGSVRTDGVPSTGVDDAEQLVDRHELPLAATGTITFDHGEFYLSDHIKSVCAKLRTSLQPARPRTPADKPAEGITVAGVPSPPAGAVSRNGFPSPGGGPGA